ncbi:hypothetical protein LZ32DRAFT_616434 [Colletotrichum eremochloae]|nr:hypothetical protein LZ32DRAFT_616434 [Colletotrichum eremochloae]
MRIFKTVLALSALAVSINALPFSVTKEEDGLVHDMSLHGTGIIARQTQEPPSALTPEPAAETDVWEFEEEEEVEEVADDGEVDAQGKKKKKKGKKGKKKGKKKKESVDENPDTATQPAPVDGAVPAAGAAPAPGGPAAAAPPPASAPAVARLLAKAFNA